MKKTWERTFGWIQDSSETTSLKKVVQIFILDSKINKELRTIKIPNYISEENGKNKFIKYLENQEIKIPYSDLKGKGIPKGYKRATAPCSGIIQAAIKSQKKEYMGDWPSECFLRWAISLGFIDYDNKTDLCSISKDGVKYANTIDDSKEETEILGNAYLSNPPVVRVLSLLDKNDKMTKFDIGKQLGFIGESGFTSFPLGIILQGIKDVPTKKEKKEIKQNSEGSSDKYARMIAGWLVNIGWLKKENQEISVIYGSYNYKEKMQTYSITLEGKKQLKKAYGRSSKKKISKNVFWEMLATKTQGKSYIRNRRTLILQSINNKEKSIEEIRAYLKNKGYEETPAVIEGDIINFTNIGLTVIKTKEKYKITDSIIKLEMPMIGIVPQKAETTLIKDSIREKLKNINTRYLSLIDLSFGGKDSDAEFEALTMDLLINELNFNGIKLGSTKKPDGIISYNKNGLIIDNKAYSKGYSLPMPQADEMIRYIEENKKRGEINSNNWWNHFNLNVTNFRYLFISSKFTAGFENKLKYINNRTTVNGGAINSQNLLLLAEKLKSGILSYDDFFELCNNNKEITIE
jgi:hypothetical protein